MICELASIINRIESDREIGAVVIQGDSSAENSFCSGLDFKLVKNFIDTPELGLVLVPYSSFV